MPSLNATHDPAARSWVASANTADTDFPIQNLPYCAFRRRGTNTPYRCGVGIGDAIVDLGALSQTSVLSGLALQAANAAHAPTLNPLMALGPAAWQALRHALFALLQDTAPADTVDKVQACLVPQADADHAVPMQVGDYTDFYVGIHHATAVGKLFRPDNPLLPNYKWVPIGYHGRASTLVPSGTPFRRPRSQVMPAGATAPVLQATARLDFELELGVVIGQGNPMGEPVTMAHAEDAVFGLTLFNDWSARDVQAWEYQPLGPFLSKNFASTVSPWVVTLEALAPYRTAFRRPAGDPSPLPYLSSEANTAQGAFDIALEVGLQTARMRAAGEAPQRISHSHFAEAAYWTVAQLVTHHTVGGCALRAGDLFGSGTLSGPLPEQAGSLLELTHGGKQALTLANGETRTFLEDGDSVVLRAHCQRPGLARIGFGACEGMVLAAA